MKKGVLIIGVLVVCLFFTINLVSASSSEFTIEHDGISHIIDLVDASHDSATLQFDNSSMISINVQQGAGPYYFNSYPSVQDLIFAMISSDANNVMYKSDFLIGFEKNFSSDGETELNFSIDGEIHSVELMNAGYSTADIRLDDVQKTLNKASSIPYSAFPFSSNKNNFRIIVKNTISTNLRYGATLLILYEKNFSSIPIQSCIDSDNGKNYYIKGSVSGLSDGGLSYSYDDSCSQNIITEWYCDGTKPRADTTYVCPNGCSNGACLNNTCTPQCAGKECGDDGCGGTCGTCVPEKKCQNGKCVSERNYCLDSNNYSIDVVLNGKNYTIEIDGVSGNSVSLIVTDSSGNPQRGNIGVGYSNIINGLTASISGSVPHSGSILYSTQTITGYISGVMAFTHSLNVHTASATSARR